MNTIEYALEQIKDEMLPVNRTLGCYEMTVIREIAEKSARSMPGGLNGNLIFEVIGIAYNYGYWQGWKHCEVERPDLNDIMSGNDPEDQAERGLQQ